MALPVNITELIRGKVVEWERLKFKKGWYELEDVEEINSGKCKETIVEFIKRLENADPRF